MFSPEELQAEVCHVLTNLNEITAEITDQESAIVSVKDEHVEKRKQVEEAVQEAKILNEEKERLKAENVRLTAKRIQLTRQCKDAQARLDRALESRKQLLRRQKAEENAIETEVRRYEDTLREIADRFRQNRPFANKEAIKRETENMKSQLQRLDVELATRRREVEELRRQYDEIQPSVPQDILQILGKSKLEEKIEELSMDIQRLTNKRDHLRNNSNVLV